MPLFCLAQTNHRIPLPIILEEIAKENGIQFNRIEEEVASYTLIPPDKSVSLRQKLDYIEKHTRLRFEKIDAIHYTVYTDTTKSKQVCGYLIDAETGKGIENAQVSVPGKSIIVISDSNGYFQLPAAEATVSITHLGYGTKTVSPSELYTTDCPTIYLTEAVTQLDEVVTEHYLASGISKSESGAIVVKPRKFSILPGLTEPDVLQTMQQLPGIISIDETVSNISVRGGTHDQNLFLWNGIRMFQTSHFFGLLSAFNPLPATTISIYKNGSPAFYDESVSSLINISTHTPAQDSDYNAVAIDMISGGFLANMHISSKDRLQVSARRSFSDVWATPTYKAYQQRVFQNTTITDVSENQNLSVTTDEDFYFYDASFSYEHVINEKHKILIDGIAMGNNLKVFQQTEGAQKKDNLKQENFGTGATIASKWDERNESEIQIYYSYYDLDATNEAIENEQTTHQGNTVINKGIRAKYGYALSPAIRFNAGYQLDEISVRNLDEVNLPAFSKNEKVVSDSHALIAEANYESKNGTTRLTAGIRGNYFNKYSIFLAEPRFLFSQKLGNSFKLELIGEQKSQTVSQIIDLQQDFLGLEKRRWVLADESTVPIQKSHQVSAGITYSKYGWYTSLEGFYKKVSGITSDSQGFQNQFEFSSSTGRYWVAGFEFLVQKKFKRFYGWISYSYNDNQYHFDTFLPPGFSNNFAVLHSVTSAGIYEWKKLRIALGTKWRTGAPLTEPLSVTIDPSNPTNSQILYNAPNSSRLRDSFQVNFSASKTWNLGARKLLTLNCSVLNILGTQNVLDRFYRINKSTNTLENINTYGLKRTPNLGLKFSF